MTTYLQFNIDDTEGSILVEIEEEAISQQTGLQKAGLRGILSNRLAVAKTSFEDAIQHVIRQNAQAFVRSVSDLPICPHETEIAFTLNMTSEIGNVAVGRLGGRANYAVKLIWRHEPKEASPDEV